MSPSVWHVAGAEEVLAPLADPAGLSIQQALLYDGALVQSRLDRDPARGAAARSAAEVLIDAAQPAAPKRRAGSGSTRAAR